MITDTHTDLAPADVAGHLSAQHAHQEDIGLALAAVTDTDLAQYRRAVLVHGDTDEEVRAEVVHECLHAEHGEGH